MHLTVAVWLMQSACAYPPPFWIVGTHSIFLDLSLSVTQQAGNVPRMCQWDTPCALLSVATSLMQAEQLLTRCHFGLLAHTASFWISTSVSHSELAMSQECANGILHVQLCASLSVAQV